MGAGKTVRAADPFVLPPIQQPSARIDLQHPRSQLVHLGLGHERPGDQGLQTFRGIENPL
jgi:hypothetical protein